MLPLKYIKDNKTIVHYMYTTPEIHYYKYVVFQKTDFFIFFFYCTKYALSLIKSQEGGYFTFVIFARAVTP